jgi:hypothetical protein
VPEELLSMIDRGGVVPGARRMASTGARGGPVS